MNKVILGLILAVCVLGMALVMLNERLGRKPDSQPPEPAVAEHRRPVTPSLADVMSKPALPRPAEETTPAAPEPEATPQEMLASAQNLENRIAEENLAPPQISAAQEQKPEEETPPPAPKAQTAPPAPGPEPAPQARPQPKPAPAETKPAPATPKPTKPEADQKPRPSETREAAQPTKAAKDKNITRFVIFAREKGATIRLAGDGPLNQKSMILEKPDRVVLDLDGDWKFPASPGIPKNDFVQKIRVGKVGDKTRVVIDLKEKPRVSRVLPAKNGESVDVRLDK